MDYTNRILHDLECNYVDLSKKNAVTSFRLYQ